jgi:hypothetical protein
MRAAACSSKVLRGAMESGYVEEGRGGERERRERTSV